MNVVATMNGWKDAPHCWATFLVFPLRLERAGNTWTVGLFGFVWFIEVGS